METRNQLVTSVAVHLDHDVAIGLRGSLDTTAVLTIGDVVEITLTEDHVRSLHEQASAALTDIALITDAENAVERAYQAAAQARTAATVAHQSAEAARQAGDHDRADRITRAAHRATDAAERAQAAVQAAFDAMLHADQADHADRTDYAAGQARASAS
ncbi:MAG: hypothetical protein HOV94_09795 [Saccharothrix sp.]|nr:hypothetical protein [Saccharothrix sp.]